MENQVKKLKLNVTNIKSHLIDSNKKLKKLQIKKNNLLTGLQQRKEIREKESRIEKKNLGIGAGFQSIMNAVTSPIRSVFDKVLDFLGLILTGIVVNYLPEIITGINEFFNSKFMKSVKSVLGGFVKIMASLGNLLRSPFASKENNEQLEKNLKQLSKDFEKDNENFESAEKDINVIEGLFSKFASFISGDQNESSEDNSNSAKEPPTLNQFSGGGEVKSKKQSSSKTSSKRGTPQQRLANNGFNSFIHAVNKMQESNKSEEKILQSITNIIVGKKEDVKEDKKSGAWQDAPDDWETVGDYTGIDKEAPWTTGVYWDKRRQGKVNFSKVSSLDKNLNSIESDGNNDTTIILAVQPVSEPIPFIIPSKPIVNSSFSGSSVSPSALWGRR